MQKVDQLGRWRVGDEVSVTDERASRFIIREIRHWPEDRTRSPEVTCWGGKRGREMTRVFPLHRLSKRHPKARRLHA
jgi:hypothetical protein